MEVYDLSEENELDTYTRREIPVLEGDEAQSLTQEELGQCQEDHCWFNHGSNCTTSVLPKDTKYVWFLDQDIWREEHKSEDGFKKIVEECEDPECRTTLCGRRRSGECRSGDNHIEWPPKIMGFIHLRNVCQKEVITFNKLWEEEEARLIRREEKMGAIEEQALTIERRSLKWWGIWRTQLLKNLLSILAFG